MQVFASVLKLQFHPGSIVSQPKKMDSMLQTKLDTLKLCLSNLPDLIHLPEPNRATYGFDLFAISPRTLKITGRQVLSTAFPRDILSDADLVQKRGGTGMRGKDKTMSGVWLLLCRTPLQRARNGKPGSVDVKFTHFHCHFQSFSVRKLQCWSLQKHARRVE